MALGQHLEVETDEHVQSGSDVIASLRNGTTTALNTTVAMMERSLVTNFLHSKHQTQSPNESQDNRESMMSTAVNGRTAVLILGW